MKEKGFKIKDKFGDLKATTDPHVIISVECWEWFWKQYIP